MVWRWKVRASFIPGPYWFLACSGKRSWVGRDLQGSLSPTLFHTGKPETEIRCLSALFKCCLSTQRVWGDDLFCGEFLSVLSLPLREEPFPCIQSKLHLMQLKAIPLCSITRQKRSVPPSLLCTLRGCRQQCGHCSVSSFLGWTNLGSSAKPRKSCPAILSPSLLPCFGHFLKFLYPSKRTHSTWGEASATLSIVGQSL